MHYFISFDKCLHPSNHLSSQDVRDYGNLLGLEYSRSWFGGLQLSWCPSPEISFADELHIHGILQYVLSCTWCLSFIIRFVAFFHIGACVGWLFASYFAYCYSIYGYASLTWMDVWTVSCLGPLWIKLPWISLYMLCVGHRHLFSYILKSGIAGL